MGTLGHEKLLTEDSGGLSLAIAGDRGHCLSRGLCFRHGGPRRASQETATRGVQPLLGLGTVESQGGLAQNCLGSRMV